MQWDRNYSSSNVDDRRGESGGGGLGFGGGGGGGGLFMIIRLLSMFGWKGILIGLVIAGAVMFGGQCTHLGSSPSTAPTNTTNTTTTTSANGKKVQSTPEEDELIHFVGFVFDDVQRTWKKEMPEYVDSRLEVFRGSLPSACGTAQTAIGPFYCPIDHLVYIDLSFYDELTNRFGAPGKFAQAYVIAHEVGHHVQNQLHLLGRGAPDSVHVELQADCFAGAWGKAANGRHILDPGDVDQALNAATQIGDDTLQKKAQGRIQPEKFTHGSAAQRRAAFQKGFDGGKDACLAM